MTPRRVSQAALLVALICVTELVLLIAVLMADERLRDRGLGDLVGFTDETWVILAAIVSSAVTGAVVAIAQPRHPVGWLFLGLSSAMLLSGVADEYTTYALLADHRHDAFPRVVAVFGDSSFVPWLVLVALVLHLTPDGSPMPGWWSRLPRVTVAAGLVAFFTAFVSPRTLAAPYDTVTNPWAVPDLARVTDPVGFLGLAVVGLSLVAGAASVVVRFRRATGDERRRLLWLALVVVPMPVFVVSAFAAATTGHDAATLWATGGFVVLVPVAAGLSVLRFQLYNVERVMGRAVSYGLLSVALVAVYAAVVLVATRATGSLAPSPAVSATLGAVTAAVLAAPLRVWLQDAVDRRFNRRRFRAESIVREAVSSPDAGADLEQLFRRALDDESVRIGYGDGSTGSWFGADGRRVAVDGDHVDVQRGGRVIARVWFDPDQVESQTAQSAASLAVSEIDNVRLRAELARQVTEVTESRRRMASAQRDERRRIERDLHDGAQQSLLALALDLQAAQLATEDERAGRALSEGVEAARAAVRQLRDLANGLHPTTLTDGGLQAAFEELSHRSQVPIDLDVRVPRLGAGLEFTAWLVASEAVVNAQKHADAEHIHICARADHDVLHLAVVDDGKGGAQPDGQGLQGLRDRVATAGGELRLRSPAGEGTTIEVDLPCGS
jgi:signal transduction histidine kinase